MKLLNYYGVVSKRPLGFKLGVPFFFFFLFVFSLFMFWLEENDVKRGTPTPTTCGRLTVTLVSLTLYIFFCLLVYLKSDFYLLQYIITAGDIHYKETNNCFPTLFFIKLGHF